MQYECYWSANEGVIFIASISVRATELVSESGLTLFHHHTDLAAVMSHDFI